MKEEIQAVEAEIEEAKKGREQRRRERLAELFLNLEGGAIFKIAAEKNGKLEQVTVKVKVEAEAKAKAKKREEERAQAAKSIRKIKQFGYTGSTGATFEWPT